MPLLLLLPFVPACASKASVEAPPPADAGEGLRELGEVYKYRASERQPAPARPDDLMGNEPALPNAWPLIQDGTIVVAWKAGYSPSSTDVLAYEKSAPAGGGKVLLRNGTVKEMTASEFKAAKR
jgi:hypothetical protein